MINEETTIRTDMTCTECNRKFVAEIDLSVDGNHIICCPWCEHEHCRVVAKGKVTGDRWSSRSQRIDVKKICVWKSLDHPIKTSTAASFVRDLWLRRLDVNP